MPVVLSDRDAEAVWSQLSVLRVHYSMQDASPYRDQELRIIDRLMSKMKTEQTPARSGLVVIK